MGWFVFDLFINFVEMMISCLFAMRLFQSEKKGLKDIGYLLLYAEYGMIFLGLREYISMAIPEFLPSVFIFTLYSYKMCRVTFKKALFWGVINCFLIGVVTLMNQSILGILLDSSMVRLELRLGTRVLQAVLVRVWQLMISEIVIQFAEKWTHSEKSWKENVRLITVFLLSIFVLTGLWKIEFELTDEVVLWFNVFICILVLIFDFMVLFFFEVLAKEKEEKEKLEIENKISSMQIRSQKEMNELYQEIRALKHDMNTHLHTISGYMQMEDYEKAKQYVQKIADTVQGIETYQSANRTLNALLGSKGALAKRYKISIQTELFVWQDLHMADEDLVTVVGNLYDNAIDACMKLAEEQKRYISIQILVRKKNLFIVFENSAREEAVTGKKIWLTTKKDTLRHGFGLKNIDRIVAEYGGYCERELNDGKFVCQIRIPIM